MGQPTSAPLAGYRIAVTSARRAEELCALLRRQGAEAFGTPAINMIALPDDDELHDNTEALIADPPDILVAHTAIGFRGWVAAAEGWGLATELIESLSSARVISRGPKATGALRAAGLREEWSPESESSHEILKYLLDSGVAGARIAIQLHGAAEGWDPFPEFMAGLRAAGAEVVPLRVYRWKPTPLGGDFDQVLAALLSGVHAMCVGAVTSRPLIGQGVPTSYPERMRLGALARHVAEELPMLGSCSIPAGGHAIEIRGTCVLVDGSVKAVTGSGMAILRALAQRPGDVVGRAELLRVLPGNGDDTHAVDTAVLRLRTALGDKNIIATVVKRGYRLAVDGEHDAA